MLILSQASCATSRDIPFSEPMELRQTVMVGDKVEIRHVSGRLLRFTVEETDEYRIAGDGHVLLWESIEAIRIRQFSTGKTVAATAGGLTVLYWIAAIVATIIIGAAMDDFGSSFACAVSFGQSEECRDDD